METLRNKWLEWGVATRTFPGQSESGDRYVVKAFRGGVLVAAVDGLGHGAEAAAAARIAVRTLEERATESLIPLIRYCHSSLARGRGAVMSLARIRGKDGTLTWMGIGNVEGRLLRVTPNGQPRDETLLLRGGVVGHALPPLQSATIPVSRGDILILATDGVEAEFGSLHLTDPVQTIAQTLVTRYAKGTDDALVVVARFLGDSH